MEAQPGGTAVYFPEAGFRQAISSAVLPVHPARV